MTRVDRSPVPAWFGLVPALALVVFFVAPFAIMLAVSVAERVPSGFYEPGFESTHYQRFMSAYFGRILLISISLSAAAAALCVALAFPFVLFLSQRGKRIQTVILVMILAVLSLSEVIIGFALNTLLSRTAGVGNLLAWLGVLESSQAFTPGLFALMAGLCYLGFPYAVLVLYPAVARIDPELPEAARVMGAAPLTTFRTVLLPLMRAPLTGAFLMVFVFTLGAYLLPQILGRPSHWTISVHITDQAIFQSNLPFAAAMAVFLLLVSLALVGLTLLLGDRKREQP